MIDSISCPVCQNLCSSQAISCPKCGHPFNQQTLIDADSSPSKTQPFVIIFKIIANISLAIGGLCGIWLLLGIIIALFMDNSRFWREHASTYVVLFVGGMIIYAFFAFLVSLTKEK